MSYQTVVCLFLLFCSHAWASKYPSDTELNAAYCIPITQHFIDGFNEGIERRQGDEIGKMFADALREKSLNLKRLQAYLLPKLYDLEVEPILTAKARADQDIQLKTSCWRRCGSSKVEGCILQCENNDSGATQRMLTLCRKVDWLPF